jgi:hypothetical protein
LQRTALRTTIQSALRKRALLNGIVGLPEKKRFFPDCRTGGATPAESRDRSGAAKARGVSEFCDQRAAVNGPTPSIVVSSLPTS